MVEHDIFKDALKQCGANWDAAQTQGLLTGRLRDRRRASGAGLDGESNAEEDDSAYAELVEYLRVAAQLCCEELAGIRNIDSEAK